MNAGLSRRPERGYDVAPRSPQQRDGSTRAPSDPAGEAIAAFDCELGELTRAIAALSEAHAANQLERWTEQRARVTSLIARTRRSLAHLRALDPDGLSDARD